MARCILRSSNFELLVKPMTNILLYRWVPQEFRQESFEGTLSPESNKIVDGCNVRLQVRIRASLDRNPFSVLCSLFLLSSAVALLKSVDA
jgi:hypothetical protein